MSSSGSTLDLRTTTRTSSTPKPSNSGPGKWSVGVVAPPPIVPTQTQGPVIPVRELPPVQFDSRPGPELALNDGTPDLPPPPVRVEAQFDPRFAADLQPPYPPSEEAAQREGRVRIRLTIGADGRVKAVQRLSATSDAFWRATERHALSRWRFRPATVDGRPVESSKVMNLTVRIEV